MRWLRVHSEALHCNESVHPVFDLTLLLNLGFAGRVVAVAAIALRLTVLVETSLNLWLLIPPNCHRCSKVLA